MSFEEVRDNKLLRKRLLEESTKPMNRKLITDYLNMEMNEE